MSPRPHVSLGSLGSAESLRSQKLLAALSSPIRREILWLVWDDERSAGDIASHFRLSAPTISGHLAVLRDAGLVQQRRQATFRFYRADRAALGGLDQLFTPPDKWVPTDREPGTGKPRSDPSLAPSTRPDLRSADRLAACVVVDVPVTQETAFEAFTDETIYSRFLGAEVTISDDGHFAATMPWGTSVRGHYDTVAAPSLIALQWDFDNADVPVPGHQLPGYVRFATTPHGCTVEVHQLVDDQAQAEFMHVAWSWVLGSFRDYVDRVGR